MPRRLREQVGRHLRGRPKLKAALTRLEHVGHLGRHLLASQIPAVIQPRPYKIMIAVTAQCNARCIGCRYGRDFMVGEQLSWAMIQDLLQDARDAGFYSVRLYGGEPTLHPDLPKMVERCVELGLRPYVTTNAITLAQVVDDLWKAGLRDISVGFYGVGAEYDDYVQQPGRFQKVEEGIATARERYGDALDIQMNWLLMRGRDDLDALQRAWDFAGRYRMPMRVDLVHYSLPYFQEGPDQVLQFRPEDRASIERVVRELIRLKRKHPDRIRHDLPGLRSIPDWLILGPRMKVPCTAAEMIWVGADGSVQLCYVCFPLGNLHERRLREMLFTRAHRESARDAFRLRCPNCHCSSNERVMRHASSLLRYGRRAEREVSR